MSRLAFLNLPIKFILLVPALTIAWTLLIGGTVTDLNLSVPFYGSTIDLQTPTEFLADTLATIVDILPFMDVVFDIFIWGLQIKLVLIIVSLFFKIISIFVQS